MADNGTLRAARAALRMSQDDFAAALRRAGIPTASKRYVQRLESGEIGCPRPRYARALEQVTRLPIEALGFDTPVPGARGIDDGIGGHVEHGTILGASTTAGQPRTAGRGTYSGVWLSRYEYYSSSRGETYAGLHYIVVIQHGDRLTVRSLPGSADSTLTMDMTVDGNVLTGTWTEQTAPTSYYRGARYHGAIQMLAEPTGRRIVGKWLGFGKDMDVNSGPWELVFEDGSTSKATLDRYNRPPTVG